MEIRIKTADEFRDAHVTIEVRAEEGEDVRVRPLVADGYPSELDWAAVRAERDEARERAARRERKIEKLTAELISEREHNNRLKLGNDELARTVTRLREELASAMDAQEINHLRETDELRSILRQVNHEKRNLEDALVKSQEATALALNQRNEYDRDRKTERDRADQNKAWAERAEAELARRSTEGKAQVDRLVETGRELRDKVRELTQDLRDRDQMIKRVRETVWARNLDRPVENRADMEVISAYGSDLVDAVAHVRSRVGQPTTSQA